MSGVQHKYGPASNLTYEDVEDPKPAAGEVLVRVCATSINPADWLVRSGAVKDIIPVAFPYIPGCDLAGTVREIGEDVTGFEPGDHVMAMALHTYAELCTVKATDLVKIPDGLEMTTAAALPLVTLTGDTLIRVGANVQPDQTVLITGALGSVGRSAVFVASQIGARVIAGVRGKRLDAARQLPGVSEAIAIDDDAEIDRLGPLDSVADTIGGKLADKFLAKVIEAFQQVAQQARKNYRRVFGTTILPGGYPPEQVEQHRLVNTWLREQGQQWFDAIFDFATPLASPDDEAVLQMAYDSGDGIHPNDEGYRLMAEAVDINQLTGNPGREA